MNRLNDALLCTLLRYNKLFLVTTAFVARTILFAKLDLIGSISYNL